MRKWLARIGTAIGFLLTILGLGFVMGKRRGQHKQRRHEAKDILKEAKKQHEAIDEMDDDDAADAIDDSISDRLGRLEG